MSKSRWSAHAIGGGAPTLQAHPPPAGARFTQLAAAEGQMGRGSLATALLGESGGPRPAWHYAFLGTKAFLGWAFALLSLRAAGPCVGRGLASLAALLI